MWTVRDVLAHLVVPLVSTPVDLARAGLTSRGSFHRFNRALVRRQAERPTADLVADLRARATSRFTPPGMDWHAPLADLRIHGLDVTIPLRLDLDRPLTPWADVLGFLVGPKATRGFVRKGRPELRFEATDVDWSHGEGSVVRGPAAALATSLTGRRALDDRLTGNGVAALLGWQGR
ncbi:MAG: hypothetical protein R2731_12320 [Nocardioides sp.]